MNVFMQILIFALLVLAVSTVLIWPAWVILERGGHFFPSRLPAISGRHGEYRIGISDYGFTGYAVVLMQRRGLLWRQVNSDREVTRSALTVAMMGPDEFGGWVNDSVEKHERYLDKWVAA